MHSLAGVYEARVRAHRESPVQGQETPRPRKPPSASPFSLRNSALRTMLHQYSLTRGFAAGGAKLRTSNSPIRQPRPSEALSSVFSAASKAAAIDCPRTARLAVPSSFYIWIHSGATVDNGPLGGERVREAGVGGCLLRAKSANPSPIPHAGSPLSREGCCQPIFRRQTQMNKLRSASESRALIQDPPRSPDQIIVNCFSELR